VEPDHSIGPDASETACPIEAIQPIFWTEDWEIDLPFVTPTVATNVPCIFLAGAEPADSSTSRAAKKYGLRFMTAEQGDLLGGSIDHSLRRRLALPVT
jgi:hypothetical protein